MGSLITFEQWVRKLISTVCWPRSRENSPRFFFLSRIQRFFTFETFRFFTVNMFVSRGWIVESRRSSFLRKFLDRRKFDEIEFSFFHAYRVRPSDRNTQQHQQRTFYVHIECPQESRHLVIFEKFVLGRYSRKSMAFKFFVLFDFYVCLFMENP